MKLFKIYFFLIFSLLATTLFAQDFKPAANPDKILADLRKSSLATSSIQADFKEEKHLSFLKEPEKSSGVFYYKKEDQMRWEQQTPFKYVILINGEKLRVLDAGKEKNVGSAGKMAGQIKQVMLGLVNGDFQQSKAFTQVCMENADYYQITLTPTNKRMRNVYAKINLLFPRSTLRLKELTFFEKGGDKSVMKFQNEKFNQSIPETVFTNL
ncbi:outer membrane lipoprotein carrier protein LolA [Dyadobacter subterraneus]|uniref:Outer membrane lipoprotein carrier protein LolA n=1 Tax=Dyadobacter subterraneus TaxID=2773304 RepID=A0ABR9WFA4_9BACT|nr:outer membrane lipoprotein carrier protein LolA [Dyadobacter subterraneus]MBE9464073.1 outer membrane lipoprotein carrier protein LolA [Dyadobacter subterraneus]